VTTIVERRAVVVTGELREVATIDGKSRHSKYQTAERREQRAESKMWRAGV
jgi:hypothetical protein